jgi:chromosomal replication initiation ATPase DnaA
MEKETHLKEITKLAEKICNYFNISLNELHEKRTCSKINIARGLMCMMSVERCYHPIEVGQYIGCSRSNVINQARKYGDYLKVKDKMITKIYNEINNE